MCFYIDQRNCPEFLIAQEDIKVFKILKDVKGNYGLSPFENFTWEKNKLIKVEFGKEGDIINEGLHAYINSVQLNLPFCEYKIYEFVIPKGSKYYINDTEIVSNQMIWKDHNANP